MNKKEFINYLIEVGEITPEVISQSMQVSDFPLARKLILKIEGFIDNILHPKNSGELDLARGELLFNCILNDREIKQVGIKFVDELVNAVRLKNNFNSDDFENGVLSDKSLSNKGVELYNQDEYEKSIIKFSEAIDLEPNDAKYYFKRGTAFCFLKKYDQAIEDFNKAIDLKSDDPGYFYFRGFIYHVLEKYNQAIEDFNKAIDLESSIHEYYYIRGEAFYYLEKYNQAIEDFNKAIDLESIHEYYFKRGEAFYNIKKYDKAIEDATKAIDLKSDEPNYFELRGLTYFILKENDKAIEDVTKAIDLKSDEPNYFELRGWAYYAHGNYYKAIEDATKAIDLKSDEPNYYRLRADARRKLYFDREEYINDLKISDELEEIKNYLNKADKYYEKNRIIESINFYEKILSESNSEIKDILGSDAMIRINNRIMEYRRMINS